MDSFLSRSGSSSSPAKQFNVTVSPFATGLGSAEIESIVGSKLVPQLIMKIKQGMNDKTFSYY